MQPTTTQAHGAPEQPQAAAAPPGIYIIDDDAHFRKTLTDILRFKGYEPQAMEQGATALAQINGNPPAVALIDLRLEDMPGLELLAAIKQHAPATECIVLTGYASEGSAIEAINLGAYGYLQKPYDIEQLLLLVRRAIEKREADAALLESEARYRSLFEDSPISLWEADFSHIKQCLDRLQREAQIENLAAFFQQHPGAVEECARGLNVLDVNQATLDLFKATDKQRLIQALNKHYLIGSLTLFQDMLLALSSTAAVHDGEPDAAPAPADEAAPHTASPRFAGEIEGHPLVNAPLHCWVQLAVAPGYEQTWEKVFVSLIDITERTRAENALRESEARLRSLIRVAPIGIGLVANRILRQVNDEICEMTGYPREDLLDQSSRMLYPDEATYRQVGQELYSDTAQREAETAETRWRRRDGTLIDVLLSLTQLDPDDLTAGYTFTALDITERKQNEIKLQRRVAARTAELQELNDELQTLNAELKRLAAAKDAFVSNVSHELRTPIANLKLRQHLLKRQPHEAHNHLEVIRRETQRLETIIEDLLHLSRLDAGFDEFNPTAVDLNAVIDEYVRDRALLAEQAGLRLITRLHPDLPLVQADGGLIGQALSVLLTNAINYTPSGGQITLSTANTSHDERDGVAMRVSDTGPGIPPEEIDRLFERFFRGEVGRKSGKAGTGLGLSIVKGIVERHDGAVMVDSSGVPGEGTTFTVWLPL